MNLPIIWIAALLIQPPAIPLAKPADTTSTTLYSGRGRSIGPSPETKKRREANSQAVKTAQKLVKNGNAAEAMAIYETLIADPKLDHFAYPDVLEGLGDIYGQQNRTSEAIALYRKLVYITPEQTWVTSRSNDPDLRLKFALLLHQSGQYAEALENYNIGMEQAAKKTRLMNMRLPMEPGIFAVNAQTAPTTRLVFASYMALAACRNNFDKAETLHYLREALKLRPNYAPIHYYLGNLLLFDDAGKLISPLSAEATSELQKAADEGSGETKQQATFWLKYYRLHEENNRKREAAAKASVSAKP